MENHEGTMESAAVSAAQVFLIVFRRGYRGGSFDGLGLQLLGVLLKAQLGVALARRRLPWVS